MAGQIVLFFPISTHQSSNEPQCEKTSNVDFNQVWHKPGCIYSYWRWLEAWNFGFWKKRYCTIQVAKTKALISFTVTVRLICVFVFLHMQNVGFLTTRFKYKLMRKHVFGIWDKLRSDTNQAVQLQAWKFGLAFIFITKTKALISAQTRLYKALKIATGLKI